ncbi:MAG: nitrilase-related carbon-nitrogen hydrolase, partial [Cyclobacteriaceae bacterium]
MFVNIGIIQRNVNSDSQKNVNRTIEQIKHLAKKGTHIICLQELYRSIYFPFEENEAHFNLAETIPGPSTKLFTDLSKELGIVIIASLFEKRAKGLYHNTTIICKENGTYETYRKNHIPDDPGFYEKYYFTPGDQGYKVVNTSFGKIGILICWDQWYPEAARCTALKGADILFYPTAIGWDMNDDIETIKEEYHEWQTIQKSH